MGYPGWFPRQVDPDDVEAARKLVPVAFLQKTTGGPGNVLLLPRAYPGLRIAEPLARPGLDFHEDEFLPVPGHDIDFTPGYGIPVVPGEYGMALPAEKRFRDGFASRTAGMRRF